jgi:hypothetical protein
LRATSPSLLQHCKRQRCHRCDLGSSDVRLTFVELSSDDSFKPYCPAPCRPVVIRTVLPSCLFIQHLFDFRPTFVRCSLDVCLTSVQSLCVTGHSQQRTVFFKFVIGATRRSWLEGGYVLTPLPTNRARIRRVRRSLEEQDQNREIQTIH